MEKYWILRDGDIYFKTWTEIGPCGTAKIAEAERFNSREDAMRSPAFTFSLTCYEPVEYSNYKTESKQI